jgi:hypothetical protein
MLCMLGALKGGAQALPAGQLLDCCMVSNE